MLNTGVRDQSFVLQQTVDIPMGTNWSPILADSHHAHFNLIVVLWITNTKGIVEFSLKSKD
jgi:hypothetical protein